MRVPGITAVVFETSSPVGAISFGAVDAEAHAALLQGWLAHPKSAFWQMGDLTVGEVAAYLGGVAADVHQSAWLGSVDGVPTFLVETYDPARVLLTGVFDAQPGDLGMHLLVAPADGPARSGLTSAIMRAVVAFCFDGLGAGRIVVEPDVENAAIAVKNAEVGFRVLGEVDLPGKRAALSVLTRPAEAAPSVDGPDAESGGTIDPAPHLSPEPFASAQRHLVAKAIAEFSHERLLRPVADGDADDAAPDAGQSAPLSSWRLELDGGRTVYRFRARSHLLEHWTIDEATLERRIDGVPAPLDVQELVLELQPELRIPDTLLPVYLEELASTAASAAFKLHRPSPSAARLADADFQSIEAAMTEGHPGFVANNGRIGYGLDEYSAYAPEAGAPVRLVWLAARRTASHLALADGLTEDAHYLAELGPDALERFADRLDALGLEAAEYRVLPVHPWQWQHRVAITFAPDVARRDLVHLGESDDVFQAQQSIRTFFNRSRPERSYVKTAIAIQNMGFLRGLSPAYMRATPAINDWVADVAATDPTLREAGFQVLREHASIGYTGDVYHRLDAPSPYRKMLAALWRESPVPRLAADERAATMAALLHRDADGDALVTALIRSSGVPAADWVRSYLHAYLRPIVHCLLAHDLAFMPHGENVILVLREHVPVRAFMKDIGEEVAVLADRELPEAVARIRQPVDAEERALAVFTDVFDGVFRHLAAILDGDGVLPERSFWALVAECIDRHSDEHPALESRVDLRAPRFAHSCLNRLQLRNTLQMVDIANQSESLIYAGTIANPIGREAG